MGNWLVVGFLVAKRLPDHLEVNQVEIVRFPKEQVEKLPKGRAIPNHAPIEQLFGRGYSVTPPDLIVRSEWVARFWVESDDRDDAYRTVETAMVPALISALNSFPGAYPAHLEIVRVIELDANRNPIPGESASPFSLPSPFRGWDEPVGLDEAEVSALTKRFTALSSDPVAVSIGRDFGDAWRLGEISSGLAPLEEAALFSFFKVIEGISKSVVKTSEFPESLEKQRQKLVDELRQALATGGRIQGGRRHDDFWVVVSGSDSRTVKTDWLPLGAAREASSERDPFSEMTSTMVNALDTLAISSKDLYSMSTLRCEGAGGCGLGRRRTCGTTGREPQGLQPEGALLCGRLGTGQPVLHSRRQVPKANRD